MLSEALRRCASCVSSVSSALSIRIASASRFRRHSTETGVPRIVSPGPSLHRPLSSLRSLSFSCASSVSIPTRGPGSRRAFSSATNEVLWRRLGVVQLFNYTSGRWLMNEALRLAERRRVFDVDGLCRLAAQSVARSPDDIVGFAKLAEGGINRISLITMRDGFRMVARVPYPITVPKYYAVANEVATMVFLRSIGLHVPEVYGYAPAPDNAAQMEYIFMEFFQGIKWTEAYMEDAGIILVLRQLVQLEAKMMNFSFPAGGSLYYPHDLDKVHAGPTIALNDDRFCVGPDVRLVLWDGRRSRLNVDRGPYESVDAALVGPAHKEVAYLQQFGQPLLPFFRQRRSAYRYQKQSPLDHIENLNHYLRIAPSLPNNILVSQSPVDSRWRIAGLLDWQHAAILPAFLQAGIPNHLQNYNDSASDSVAQPSLRENFNDLDEAEQSRARDLDYPRFLPYPYVKKTAESNGFHFAALTLPLWALRRRLLRHAGAPWWGETLELKVALIEATAREKWETLVVTRGGASEPCPVAFDAEDIRLDAEQTEMDKGTEVFNNVVGVTPDGWVSSEDYEGALMRSKLVKQDASVASESIASAEVRAEIEKNWIFDDMDEEIYM